MRSIREFLTSDEYLGNNVLEMAYYTEEYTSRDIYESLVAIFSGIAHFVTQVKSEYIGTKIFKAKAMKQVIKDKSILLSFDGQQNIFDDNRNGLGVSQNEVSDSRLRLDLSQEDWYVYQDNFGTSEEKKFLVYFKTYIAPKLDEKHLEYYVIRNERIADLDIYSFDDGERFEPDFLLFIKSDNESGYNISQVYAEPKGDHLLEKDRWKGNFLTQIESVSQIDDKYTFNNNYRVFGLPLFNEQHELVRFKNVVEEILKKF